VREGSDRTRSDDEDLHQRGKDVVEAPSAVLGVIGDLQGVEKEGTKSRRKDEVSRGGLRGREEDSTYNTDTRNATNVPLRIVAGGRVVGEKVTRRVPAERVDVAAAVLIRRRNVVENAFRVYGQYGVKDW
jgi:hypothetical protein